MKSKFLSAVLTSVNFILTMGLFMCSGVFIGRILSALVSEEDTGAELLVLLCSFFGIMLFYFIFTILHEAGHLICGLLSDWSFVSFRVGSLTLVKRDGKIVRKKHTVMGTGGQCLLDPPDCAPEKCPFKLYLFGGGLMNLAVGAVFFLISALLPEAGKYAAQCAGTLSLAIGMNNLVPMKLGGIVNDGYHIFFDIDSGRNRAAQYYMLKLNAVLTDVPSFEDVPEKLINDVLGFSCEDLGNIGEANLFMFQSNIYEARGEYEKWREICERVSDSREALEIFRLGARCDLLYIKLLNGEEIGELYDAKLKKYIKATLMYPSTRRLMHAYFLLHEKDAKKAEEEYAALTKNAETHPIRAESALSLKEADKTIRIACENGILEWR